MSQLYLTRARLRVDPPAAALRAVLAPSDASARAGASHRLVWTLFADSPDRKRDFLWREANEAFYILSQRRPRDTLRLFDLDPPKLFAPCLRAGEHLLFSLRANATVAIGGKPPAAGNEGTRGKRCDVVMNALQSVSKDQRPARRREAILEAGRSWLVAQGARSGFALAQRVSGVNDRDMVANEEHREHWVALRVTGYHTLALDRQLGNAAGGRGPATRSRRDARIGVLDFDGELEVLDPERFVAALAVGFGRAKAFGCGLMLIRRA